MDKTTKEYEELSNFFRFSQEMNPEKYDESIMTLKENDDIKSTLEDACKTLEVIPGITFLGVEKSTDKNLYKYFKPDSKIKNAEIDYEDTRLINYKMKFKLEAEDEEKIVEKVISFPKLIDNAYYLINSIRYYPIIQLIDAEAYSTNKSVTLRTSLQPIMIFRKRTSATDVFNSIELDNIYLFSKIFSIKCPILLYYLSQFGMNNTLKYFNLPYELFVSTKKIKEDDYEDYYVFKLGKKFADEQLYLKIEKEKYDLENSNNEILLLTFLDVFKKEKIPFKYINDKDFWIKKLGSHFTQNTSNHYNKGLSVKKSFERLFDNTTKKLIRIPDSDKENIYTLIRWLIINYSKILRMNNNDLANKRLRLNETFLYPLQEHWTKGVLRILNNNRKYTISSLYKLFSTITPDFLIKKNTRADNDNLRYANLVNTLDAGIKLKITSAGPQSISNSNGEIKGKDLDISFLGNIDIIYTSAGDPGTTRMLTPTCQLTDSWHFTEMPNVECDTFEENEELDEDDIYQEFTYDIEDFNID